MANRTTGAARWFTEKDLDGPSRSQESITAVSATAITIVPNNPDRVALVLVNQGTADVNISLIPIVSLTAGIRLAAGGGFVSMIVKDDYTVVSREWFGISITGTNNVYALETIADVIMAPEQV